MRVLIDIVGLISLLMSAGSCAMAKGAIHEINGTIFLLIAMVCFCSTAVIGEMKKQQVQS